MTHFVKQLSAIGLREAFPAFIMSAKRKAARQSTSPLPLPTVAAAAICLPGGSSLADRTGLAGRGTESEIAYANAPRIAKAVDQQVALSASPFPRNRFQVGSLL